MESESEYAVVNDCGLFVWPVRNGKQAGSWSMMGSFVSSFLQDKWRWRESFENDEIVRAPQLKCGSWSSAALSVIDDRAKDAIDCFRS
jgi:hypothetical protein